MQAEAAPAKPAQAAKGKAKAEPKAKAKAKAEPKAKAKAKAEPKAKAAAKGKGKRKADGDTEPAAKPAKVPLSRPAACCARLTACPLPAVCCASAGVLRRSCSAVPGMR